MLFNGRLLGRTRTIANTLDPDWEGSEVFALVLPVGRALAQCCVEVELHDHDAMSQDDFLGCRVLEGAQLVALMAGSADSASQLGNMAKPTARGVAYQLQRSTNSAIDQSLAVRGDLELGGRANTENNQALAAQLSGGVSVKEVADCPIGVLEFVQNLEPLTVVLNIFAATNLAKADTFGKR